MNETNFRDDFYQPDTDSIRERAKKLESIAAENLKTYREHIGLSLRTADCITGCCYTQLLRYEQRVTMIFSYYYMLGVYREMCRHYNLEEPEGIVSLDSLM